MTDFPDLLRGPATVKDEMTAIYLSAKDARRAADYVERLEAENARLRELHKMNERILGFLFNELQGRIDGGKLSALEKCLNRCRAALQDTTT